MWGGEGGGGTLLLAESKQGHMQRKAYPSLEMYWREGLREAVVEVLSVCVYVGVCVRQQ